MKRIVLALLTIFVLTAAGALVAQSSQNTTAPGPTQQRAPGMTNNNLPNPGNPQTDLSRQNTTGTTTGTMGSTTSTATGETGVRPETEQGSGVDVDVDTGSRANGAVDVDVSRTTDADTDASGIDETGGLTNDRNDRNVAGGADRLPNTASDLPLTALIGLICLGAAFSIRTLAKRDI